MAEAVEDAVEQTVPEYRLPPEHPLYRPRHGRTQRLATLCAVLFFALPAVLAITGVRGAADENHKPAVFPSWHDGWAWFTGLSPWATDNLAFRSPAIAAAEKVSSGVFGEQLPFDSGGDVGGPIGVTNPPAGQQNGTGQNAGYRRVLLGKNNWMYLGDDISWKCNPARPLAETITDLARLRQVIEQSGRKFELVIPPDKTTMEPGQLPDSYPGKACAQAATTDFWQRFPGPLHAIDLRPQLTALRNRLGKPVYYSQDSHWTDAGAVEMVRAVADAIKPGVASTWRVTPSQPKVFAADLPPLVNQTGTDRDSYYDLAPDGHTNQARMETTDDTKPLRMEGAHGTGTIQPSTVWFGDSFTLPALRYIAGAFSDVTYQTYGDAEVHRDLAMNLIAQSKIVVLQLVERSAANGTPRMMEPSFTTKLAALLAKHPVR